MLYLYKAFEKIGAEVKIVTLGAVPRFSDVPPPVRLNVITINGKEMFEVAIREDVSANLDLSVLEIQPKERHLVLLARQLDNDGKAVEKNHFLCGFDERHLFVAAVGPVSTVAGAKLSLKPREISGKETGLSVKKRNRRKTALFKRQGEWFFIPANIKIDDNLVLANEPLVRGAGSKPHIAQFAYRFGGELVKVCERYPNGLTHNQYEKLITRNPKARNYKWRDMRREARVFVKGSIKHLDHATLVLDSWHRVLMNTENSFSTEKVAFLD